MIDIGIEKAGFTAWAALWFFRISLHECLMLIVYRFIAAAEPIEKTFQKEYK